MTVSDEQHLTDRKTLKDWCGITLDETKVLVTGGDVLSTILDNLIVRASNFIMMEIGRTNIFTQTNVSETRNGNDNDTIFPYGTPITSVHSVTINGVVIPQRPSVLGYGWTYDKDAIYLIGYLFDCGIQNIVLNYDCGISVSSRNASILEQGILEMINMKWQRRAHADHLSEKSSNFMTVQFKPEDIPVEVRNVINKLRNRVPFE